ncbi:hypothetical protein EVAR_71574_1 [Eumeta japonica]|uniref:Uncharacterized protein n=1 Tax=Eumeta variegata TaxID=151549 RepID=A0A4C1TPT1_EUMVA|nr:hypothetical protein EVAR_71574_1 [Eumeta japonica]
MPQLFRERERLRRNSQSTSTASGISTYASSLRRTITTNSSDFLGHRETFCLTPEDDDDDEVAEHEADDDLVNDYCRNLNYEQARNFDLDNQNKLPIDDTSNLLTDEHLNL